MDSQADDREWSTAGAHAGCGDTDAVHSWFSSVVDSPWEEGGAFPFKVGNHAGLAPEAVRELEYGVGGVDIAQWSATITERFHGDDFDIDGFISFDFDEQAWRRPARPQRPQEGHIQSMALDQTREAEEAGLPFVSMLRLRAKAGVAVAWLAKWLKTCVWSAPVGAWARLSRGSGLVLNLEWGLCVT